MNLEKSILWIVGVLVFGAVAIGILMEMDTFGNDNSSGQGFWGQALTAITNITNGVVKIIQSIFSGLGAIFSKPAA